MFAGITRIAVSMLLSCLCAMTSCFPRLLEAAERRPRSIDPDAVTVAPADEQGVTPVLGRRGSVPAARFVVIHTLDTDEVVVTQANDDGSFSVEAFAPPGCVLQIHHRLRRPPLPELDPDPSASPALILEVSEAADGDNDSGITADAILRHELARIQLHGRLSSVQVAAGEDLGVSGSLLVTPIPGATVREIPDTIECGFELVRLFRADGGPLAPVRLLASSFLTPTGLPVEAPEDSKAVPCGGYHIVRENIRASAHRERFTASVSTRVDIPPDLPDGYYMLGVRVHFDPACLYSERPAPNFFQESQAFLPARLAILRIGHPAPPQLAMMLLPGLVSNGARGVLPPEDQREWAVSPAAVFQTPVTVFPRRSVDGSLVPFCFEPGLPLVALANRPFPLTLPRPLIPFLFPGGRYEAEVRLPSGDTHRIGPVTLVGARNHLNLVDIPGVNPARVPIEAPMAYGNNYLGDVYQLTCADPEAAVLTFDEDGTYRVKTHGEIHDRFGHRYSLDGSFEFVLAQPCDLDLGMYTGTPLVVGSEIAPVVHVRPSLPAEVVITLRHYPSSRKENETIQEVRGTANRFGYFAPADSALTLDEPGEYVMDVAVSGQDSQGRLWEARARGASVVAPKSTPLIVHGERGLRSPEANRRLAWFIEGQRPDVVRRPGAGIHTLFPYHHGDVLWVQDHESIFPAVRFEDPSGVYANIVERLRPEIREGTYGGFFNHELMPINMRVVGELPLFSRAREGRPIGQYPEQAEYISYAYTSTVRPGMGVRSLVHESSFLAYWALDEPFNLQYGIGPEGDLPNDIKLQFAGVVLRGCDKADSEAAAFPQYGLYASMAVVVSRDDPLGNRVTPPFRGAGGGPNGGPLLTARGRAFDLFVTPTGVLPGTICEVGDRFTYSGYVWPTLPAEVHWEITGPDNFARAGQVEASPVGYFYDPATDFTLDKPGLYQHHVALTYRGKTSSGPVCAPYPTGDLPGSKAGESHFVVVDRDEPLLDVQVERRWKAMHWLQATVPRGWTDARAWITVWLPGFLLEDRALEVHEGKCDYLFHPQQWRLDFPNIDQAPVDTFVVTLSVSGRDAEGHARIRGRQIVMQGAQVWGCEDELAVALPGRGGCDQPRPGAACVATRRTDPWLNTDAPPGARGPDGAYGMMTP